MIKIRLEVRDMAILNLRIMMKWSGYYRCMEIFNHLCQMEDLLL